MTTWIEKVKATRERHSQMSCKTFELKIDKSSLSKEKIIYLERLFSEAKWLQNHILSSNDISDFDTKSNKVIVINKDRQKEEREIINLSSQMKSAVKQKIENAIRSLSSKKA